jgi:hypothetical protein
LLQGSRNPPDQGQVFLEQQLLIGKGLGRTGQGVVVNWQKYNYAVKARLPPSLLGALQKSPVRT